METKENAGKESQKISDDVVTNEHLGKCVRTCVTDIQVTKGKMTWKHDLVSMVFLIAL